MTTFDDEWEEDDEAAFLSNPRGSSLHRPMKMVAASGGGGGEDEAFKAAVAFETLAATSPRPLAPRKPIRASTVLLMSSAQTNDDKGRADLALLRAREMPLARQVVGDDDGTF